MKISGVFRYHIGTVLLFAVCSMSVSLLPQQASAYHGRGYYTGSDTCTTDYAWSYRCYTPGISRGQNNVLPTAISSSAYSGGSQAAIKANFASWLMSQYASGDSRIRSGAGFILDTMIGSRSSSELLNRLSNSNITITYVSSANPRAYGTVSFRGRINGGSTASDYFFSSDYYPSNRALLVFRNGGTVVYVLEVLCANPIGGLPGLPSSPPPPPPATWSLNSTSSVDSAKAIPGATVQFSHAINNAGPNQATGVRWTVRNESGATVASSGGAITLSVGPHPGININTFVIPPDAIAGQKFCQYIAYDPSGSNPTTGLESSVQACVEVIYDYELTPSITFPATIPVGSNATFSFVVNKTGTATNDTSLAVRQIIIPAGATFLKTVGGLNEDVDCAHYTEGTTGRVECTEIESLPNRRFTASSTSIGVSPSSSIVSTVGLQAGDRICRVLSIRSRDETPALGAFPWHNRDFLGCTVVTKSPYIAISGGDASAGGSMAEPCADVAGFKGSNSGTAFGSFGEYGLFATGDVSNFASAGMMSPIAQLTFANVSVPYGHYISKHCINDYVALLAGSVPASSPTFGGGSLPHGSGNYQVTAAGVTINASTLNRNDHILIYAPGKTVTIAGNITYDTSGYRVFDEIPSLVVVANRINVNAGVTQIDGLYYAGGANGIFTTCTEAGDTPSTNKPAIKANGTCKEQLVVNGSVIAKKLINPRTKGGIDASMSAETFSMRPESFLTPYARGAQTPVMTVQFSKELSPRY